MLLAARLCPDPLRQLNHSSRLLAAAKGEGQERGEEREESKRRGEGKDCLCQLGG